MTTDLENGLIVNFNNSSIYAVEALIENSSFYGYKIEDPQIYLFPCSDKNEYDVLEMALTNEFNSWNIKSFTFEGV